MEMWKVGGKGQIPRLGLKLRSWQKTVGPIYDIRLLGKRYTSCSL